MHIELAQIFTQIVSFLVMLWVLKRFAWKPLLKLLDERRNKIQSEFDTIEEQKRDNELLALEYQEKLKAVDAKAWIIIKEAGDKGHRLLKEIEDEAHAEAKAIVAKAQDELQHEIAKAKVQLRGEIVNMTLAATQKVIETNLDTEKQKKLINDFVEKAEIH